MTHHPVSLSSRSDQGFSLIELMVSLAIGLIISAAAFSTYLGASGAARMAEAQSRMNEDAQAALSILTQQLRMAGNNPMQNNRIDNIDPTLSSLHNPVYLPTPTNATPTVGTSSSTFIPYAFAIRGCDGTFNDITTASSLDNLTCTVATGDLPYSIAISYEADKFNTVPTSQATGSLPTDCLGNQLAKMTAAFILVPAIPATSTASAVAAVLAPNVTYYVADNRFYIANSATVLSPSLYCKGNGGASTAQPMVENIEDMQFTYGVLSTSTSAASTTTGQVAGYLKANQVAALHPLNPAAGWKKVISVRVCVVVRSEVAVLSDSASAAYLTCDGTLSTAQPDRRLRRTYSTTVVLRNRRL